MPKIHIEGLMTGNISPELNGSTIIRSSSGYTAKIDYISKGWIGGRKNGFSAQLFHDDNENTPLYTVEGQWSDSWICKDLKTQKVVEKFDINSAKRTPLQVAPINAQHPLESRRAWHHVAQAIHKGDIFAISYEKSKIENEQREMRIRERQEGSEFPRRYFSKAKEDPVAQKLAQEMNCASIEADMDIKQGVWVWDDEKDKRIEACKAIKSPARARFDSGVGGIFLDPAES